MWHRLVWEAQTQPDKAVASLQQLSLWGEAVLPRVSKAWGSCRGPLSAAALSLARAGWSFQGPF
eukprot:4383134-Pyramimonas_sp.AAC.1